jgi:cleavage and polyadenylation specificity factor subunit 5
MMIYDLDQYKCGTGEDRHQKTEGVQKLDRMTRICQLFRESETVRSVRAVLLVHCHRLPHVLLLERIIGNTSSQNRIMPGGKLAPGEDDETGLHRILDTRMPISDGAYDVAEHLATWYRPQFTEQVFPYKPVHVTKPKEIESWYLVRLPEKGSLRIDPKYRLRAASFYELQGATAQYGQQLPFIPLLVSRLNIIVKDK